jgi:hypothetical protein
MAMSRLSEYFRNDITRNVNYEYLDQRYPIV